MAFDYEKIVRNLFAKADAEGVTPAEKAALEEKAYELIQRHHVNIAKNEGVIKDGVTHYPLTFSGLHQHDQALLFATIAKHYNVTILQGKNECVIYGFDSDITTAEVLYSIIEPQMFASLARAVKPVGLHGRTFNNSFLKSFIIKIRERLDEAKRKIDQDTSNSTALVLRDRALEVRKALPAHRTGAKSRYYSNEGSRQGREAGERATFNVNPDLSNGINNRLTK